MISDDFSILKYIDFGLSKELENDTSLMSTKVGTGRYMAPEIFFQRQFNQKVDVWLAEEENFSFLKILEYFLNTFFK